MTHNKNSMIKRKVQTVLLCRNANKQIQFLLLQTNIKRDSFWQNVTGSVDPGEEFEQAALREAIEETAIAQDNIGELIPLDMEFNFTDRWGEQVTERVFILECKRVFEPVIDPDEHQAFKWTSAKDITNKSVKFESNWQALSMAMERYQ